jgi:hypothetical protein
MFPRTSPLWILLIGLVAAMPAHAQWKWRDAAGQTQYSDLPPPQGTPEKDILQRPKSLTRAAPSSSGAASAAGAASAPLLAGRASEPELEARRKKAEQEAADKVRSEAAKAAAARAENCARAQSQLRTLDSGIRIARTNEKGEREILDDPARAAELQRTRQVIASDCR